MEPVVEEMNLSARRQVAGGVAPATRDKMLEGFKATRKKAARSMKGDADEILLDENTTTATSIAA